MKNITKDIIYVGVNDHKVDLFEGQYDVPNGMAYNSYVVLDEKVTVFDTVDANFNDEWLENVHKALDGRKPDYLVVQHMEPDHSANIFNFAKVYPDAKIVANTKTFVMMKQFFGTDFYVLVSIHLHLSLHQWFIGQKLWLHMIALIRYYSQQMALVSLELLM